MVREFVEHNKANIEPEVIEKDVRDLVEFEKKIYKMVFILRFFYLLQTLIYLENQLYVFFFQLQENSELDYAMTTVGEFFESYRSNIIGLKETDLVSITRCLCCF